MLPSREAFAKWLQLSPASGCSSVEWGGGEQNVPEEGFPPHRGSERHKAFPGRAWAMELLPFSGCSAW